MEITKLFHGAILTHEEPGIHAENLFSAFAGHQNDSANYISYEYKGKQNRACYQRLVKIGSTTESGHNSYHPEYRDDITRAVKIGDIVIMDEADCQQDDGPRSFKKFDLKSIVAVFKPEWNHPRPIGDWVMLDPDPEHASKLVSKEIEIPTSAVSAGLSVAKGSLIKKKFGKVVDVGPGRYWRPNNKSQFVHSLVEVSPGELVGYDPPTRLELIFRGKKFEYVRMPFIDYVYEE